MEIRTLQDSDIDDLLSAFNEAFTGYFVPLQLTKEQLTRKLNAEGFEPELATGAYREGRLCGFILHCTGMKNGRKVVYNGGTGVIPAARNQALTRRMYEFSLAKLKEENIDSVILEVITENIPAIKTYERVGFKTKRKLISYKGEITAEINSSVIVKEMNAGDWKEVKNFLDFEPSWQNSDPVLERLKNTNVCYGAFVEDRLAGYLVYNPLSKRVQQFGVDKSHRRKKVASTLFSHIGNEGDPVSILNIEESSTPANAFMQAIGLKKFLEQYEMELDLPR